MELRVCLEEVGTECLRAGYSLLMLPLRYARFVATEQDVRHAPPFVLSRAGVHRRREQAILKGVAQRTIRIA